MENTATSNSATTNHSINTIEMSALELFKIRLEQMGFTPDQIQSFCDINVEIRVMIGVGNQEIPIEDRLRCIFRAFFSSFENLLALYKKINLNNVKRRDLASRLCVKMTKQLCSSESRLIMDFDPLAPNSEDEVLDEEEEQQKLLNKKAKLLAVKNHLGEVEQELTCCRDVSAKAKVLLDEIVLMSSNLKNMMQNLEDEASSELNLEGIQVMSELAQRIIDAAKEIEDIIRLYELAMSKFDELHHEYFSLSQD